MTKTEAPRVREGVNINAWVDEDVGRAFEDLVAGFRPRAGKKSHLEEALRDYCKKLGFPVGGARKGAGGS